MTPLFGSLHIYTQYMKDSIVHIRVPGEIVAALDQRAGVELRSRSNLAAYLIREGLAEPADEKRVAE
jgi:CopG-like RHH_1 or ribbon-helix-helix domain, RHH_5